MLGQREQGQGKKRMEDIIGGKRLKPFVQQDTIYLLHKSEER
jgi:hypothetical protein